MSKWVCFAEGLSRAELARHYALCDLFVLANRVDTDDQGAVDIEGFGMVFLEANCAGKPVVGGRSGGVVDAIEDGKSGFLCDPDSPADFARAIDTLLSDAALAERMGAYGRDRARRDFGWEQRSRAVYEATKEVSREHRPSLAVVSGGGHDGDVHPSDLDHLVVVDLREDELLGDPDAVVAASVESTRIQPAEVADPG